MQSIQRQSAREIVIPGIRGTYSCRCLSMLRYGLLECRPSWKIFPFFFFFLLESCNLVDQMVRGFRETKSLLLICLIARNVALEQFIRVC